MSCPTRREDILAWLDRSLDPDRAQALRAHLEDCPACSRFHVEQLEFGRLLESAAEVRLEPPARIWHRIESELAAGQAAGFPARTLLDLFRLPRFAYGFAAFVLLALTALVAIQTRDTGLAADEVLARLDAFSIQTSGNPFLTPPMEAQNPFFILERDEPDNPFQPGGGLK